MEEERKRKGYVWHMYHDHLLTYCWDYDWRVRDIKNCKPVDEIEERLKRFQLVKGELPSSFVGAYLDASHVSRLVEEHEASIDALHRTECPRCTWNGIEMVFSRGDRIRRMLGWMRNKLSRVL